jgi:hypothetical protein
LDFFFGGDHKLGVYGATGEASQKAATSNLIHDSDLTIERILERLFENGIASEYKRRASAYPGVGVIGFSNDPGRLDVEFYAVQAKREMRHPYSALDIVANYAGQNPPGTASVKELSLRPHRATETRRWPAARKLHLNRDIGYRQSNPEQAMS